MNTYIVSGNCADYYCGCGLAHLVGVFSTMELARQAQSHAAEMTHSYVTDTRYNTFPHGTRITSAEVDQLPERHEIR